MYRCLCTVYDDDFTLDNNYDNGSFYLSKTDDGIDIYILLNLVV